MFFFRGGKENRDEMGLIVFLIGVPRKSFDQPKKNLVMSLSFCRNTLSRFKIVIGPVISNMFGNVCAFAIACPSPGVVPLHLQPTRHH